MNPVAGRLTFVRRITTLATGAGAIFLGLVPEAKTRAATSQAAALAAVVTPMPTDASAEPRSSPLSLLRQNQLYSAVLNDAGVGLLLSSAGVPGRIDPPIEHSEVALAGGSDWVAIVPERHTGNQRAGMFSFPLPVPSPEITVSMLRHPREDADTAHRWLRPCVTDACAGQSQE